MSYESTHIIGNHKHKGTFEMCIWIIKWFIFMISLDDILKVLSLTHQTLSVVWPGRWPLTLKGLGCTLNLSLEISLWTSAWFILRLQVFFSLLWYFFELLWKILDWGLKVKPDNVSCWSHFRVTFQNLLLDFVTLLSFESLSHSTTIVIVVGAKKRQIWQ